MIFEDFVNTIKAINKIVSDDDMRDIESYIGFIEKKLNKIAGKNNDKLYSLIGEAIEKMPTEYIVNLSVKEELGYKITDACKVLDSNCDGDIYEFFDDNGLYVITNGRGFVKLIKWEDMVKSDQWKHVINMLAHHYELILNNPDIPDCYKNPIRKIENLFNIFGVKEK